VHDEDAHGDEPQLVLPLARKQHKEHDDLVKLLQAAAALVHLHIAAVAEPHDVGFFGGDQQSQYVSVDPQAYNEYLLCQPVGRDIDHRETLDDAGEIPPQFVEYDCDEGEEGDINHKAKRTMIELL